MSYRDARALSIDIRSTTKLFRPDKAVVGFKASVYLRGFGAIGDGAPPQAGIHLNLRGTHSGSPQTGSGPSCNRRNRHIGLFTKTSCTLWEHDPSISDQSVFLALLYFMSSNSAALLLSIPVALKVKLYLFTSISIITICARRVCP